MKAIVVALVVLLPLAAGQYSCFNSAITVNTTSICVEQNGQIGSFCAQNQAQADVMAWTFSQGISNFSLATAQDHGVTDCAAIGGRPHWNFWAAHFWCPKTPQCSSSTCGPTGPIAPTPPPHLCCSSIQSAITDACYGVPSSYISQIVPGAPLPALITRAFGETVCQADVNCTTIPTVFPYYDCFSSPINLPASSICDSGTAVYCAMGQQQADARGAIDMSFFANMTMSRVEEIALEHCGLAGATPRYDWWISQRNKFLCPVLPICDRFSCNPQSGVQPFPLPKICCSAIRDVFRDACYNVPQSVIDAVQPGIPLDPVLQRLFHEADCAITDCLNGNGTYVPNPSVAGAASSMFALGVSEKIVMLLVTMVVGLFGWF